MTCNKQRVAGVLVLIGFCLVQGYASLTKTHFYPFSPYRMFSKFWNPGVIMDQVSFKTPKGIIFSPRDLINVPFFLANHLSFTTFLDPSTEEQKKAICVLIQKKLSMAHIEVFAGQVKYDRINGVIHPTIVRSERVYTCE